ncbi:MULTISPECIES: SIMPL domain-containing protein [unclassified Pseudodesulfovibrio]|uniref:SIMPL domain-containing protein n=1 Tax=unclassified Pseudodesulfovibrio TaxID=2661612 RepID=UPI000FEB6AAA|nr:MULTISPECIES: SIMPL domain-containing protein [unclassified Pseudodesulfovibrio]MCJ2164527.1 SIMPL domain-containing protein [Pseudodesulfovibrio sp. S3-i]RWU04725.1 SIMPL domain-containing protein [Pseudodesulfovibrio sp. S3]
MEQKYSSHSIITGAILALGIVAGCWVLGNALVGFKAMDRYVSVKGLAEREVPADLAMWPISFSAAADTLPELDEALAQSRAQIMIFLKAQGLGDAEIMNAAPLIQDNQMNMPNQRPAQRYTAQAVLTVRSKDIPTVKKGMSAAGELVSLGVMLVQNWEFRPTFTFTGLNAIKPDMIAEATRNARDAAKQFAEDSGSRVGNIRRASQGYFSLEDRDQYTPEIKQIRVVTNVDYFLED